MAPQGGIYKSLGGGGGGEYRAFGELGIGMDPFGGINK